MKQRSIYTFIIFLISLISFACLSPYNVFTEKQTLTLTPSLTPIQQAALGCSMDLIVQDLRNNILFEQVSVDYTIFDDEAVLEIWFVDSNIQPEDESFDVNVETALLDEALLAFQVVSRDSCVSKLFDSISLVAVDEQYNLWSTLEAPTSDLPPTNDPTIDEIREALVQFVNPYLREIPPKRQDSSPVGGCTWFQAEQAIRQHFAATRPNVAFYYSVIDTGANVFAHWDGPTDNIADVHANLLNIMMEIRCLYPAPTALMAYIVDKKGIIQQIGGLPVKGITTIYYSDYSSLIDGYYIFYQR